MGERTLCQNPFKKRYRMVRLITLISFALALASACVLHAQGCRSCHSPRKRRYLEKGHAAAATRAYEQAKQKTNAAVFNLGNAWYDQDSLARAQQAYETAAAMAKGEQSTGTRLPQPGQCTGSNNAGSATP
jgi:hypothetical protein